MSHHLLRSLYKYSRAVIRSVLIITNNFYCIPAHVVWLWLLTPLRKYLPAIYNRIEGLLFSWLLAMVSMWSWSAGYDIVEEGDDISRCLDRPTLVMLNHQSTADVPILMAAFNAKQRVLPHIMWIMDRMFRYTNFGVVSSYHRDFFIASGKARRDESVRRLEEHLKSAYIPLRRKWIVLFPEGGFLTKRRPISQRFAEKNNLPVLQNVTVPRMGALFVIRDTLMGDSTADRTLVDKEGDQQQQQQSLRLRDNNNQATDDECLNNNNNSCFSKETTGDRLNGGVKKEISRIPSDEEVVVDRPELEYILDITIGYPEGKPLNLQTILTGLRAPCRTVLYYRLYPAGDLPRDDAGLTQWTYNRFFEKETLLASFYKNRTFLSSSNGEAGSSTKEREPGNAGRGSYLVQQDLLRFVILHIFFISSSYFHYRVFATVVQDCISLLSYLVL